MPAVGAGAETEIAPAAVEHWSPGNDDRRHVGARRAHDAGRSRLVAPRQQDNSVQRIGANALLDIHRHEIAVQHRRRFHERLAERHDRELKGKSSRLENAALGRLGEPAEVCVAVDELAPAVAYPDDRSVPEGVVGDPFGLQPRPVQKGIEVGPLEPVPAAVSVGAPVTHYHDAPSISSLAGCHSRAAWSTTSPLPPHLRHEPSSLGPTPVPPHSGQEAKTASAQQRTSPQPHIAATVRRRSPVMSMPSKRCPGWT
jgi:hypothetical protein